MINAPIRYSSVAITTLLLVISARSRATTWDAPEHIPDPLLSGETCEVSRPVSYGSYVYSWPSKYDQVFWPFIDEHAIWMCRQSGFAAFLEDFELTAEEKSALREHLAATYKPKSGRLALEDKLRQLQLCYSLRNKDIQFNIKLPRILAFYRENDLRDIEGATRLRRIALAMIETELTANPPVQQQLEYLFVAAAYYREFGETVRSDNALVTLRATLAANSDDKLKDYVEYLGKLLSDIPNITPGGTLAPK